MRFLILFGLCSLSGYCQDTINIKNGIIGIINEVNNENKICNNEEFSFFKIKKKKRSYTIILDDKKKIVLKDNTDKNNEVKIEKYKFLGYYKNVNILIFNIEKYETTETLLINKLNGQMKSFVGTPTFLKSRNKFFIVTGDIQFEDIETKIEMWEIIDNYFNLLWEFPIYDFNVQEVCWLNEHEIIFKKIIPDYLSKNNIEEKILVKLEIEEK